jgi:thiol-disulfide isomerase/thioredoxin
MIPPRLENETPLRATVRILAWTLFVIAGITLIALSILSNNRKTAQTGVVFAINSEPRTLPNVRFADAEGKTVTLQDFRGKVILLNVWATWCPPCRKEMPSLDRLQQQLGGPGFAVVALSIDRGGTPTAIRSFYEETNVRALAVYIDASAQASGQLGVVGIPTTLLIDGAGREIGRLTGPAEWDSPAAIAAIRRHLDAPPGS